MSKFVSVMVVTYNSAATVEETLNSILSQTIGSENIELVISNDASKDNTVDVIERWLRTNSNKFKDTVFLNHKFNQGVSKNCNAGWKACTADWIKSIGGDDVLELDCLEKNISYTNINPECNIVFSKMKWFGRINKITPEPINYNFFKLSAVEQYEYLRFKSFNIAPTSFIRRETLADIGYADERFSTIEDLPLWLRFTKNNNKLYYFPEVTVRYRISDSASKHSKRYINEKFLNDLIKIYSELSFSDMKNFSAKALKIDMSTLLYGKKIILVITNNRVGALSRALDYIHLLLRPFYIVIKIKRYIFNYVHKNND
ncbi:glycosyltransferase [Enterobacteriaceae bacterium H16N7]|nr:glycosyltransferase [Dryocola clanedunensis]